MYINKRPWSAESHPWYYYRLATTLNQNFTVETANPSLKEQNVTFNDQSAGYVHSLNSVIDTTRTNTDAHDVELGNFFERPLKIASYEWSTTVTFFENFNPWSLYLGNPRVANRISNYKLLKGKLHVKFMINGNAFYYGRLLANYTPRRIFDKLIVNRALISADNVEASQRPHIFIDPCTNQAGQIDCPFLCPTDALNITTDDWADMGEMNLRELNPLKHANGATDPITITVMAWMSEVTLTAPTATNAYGLSPQNGFEFQSGKEKSKTRVKKVTNKPNQNSSMYSKQDEYGSGPVSGPASTVARIAGMLKEAPVIGPYAKATQIAASGISNIAKLFGYSRPPTLAPEVRMQQRTFAGMSVTNTPDEVEKLAIDAKQELTVDGSVVGLDNTDEMTIKSIATRESYLDTCPWTTSTPVGNPLFSALVTPCHAKSYGTSPTERHCTAAQFATLPFKYWRGTVKYRFQIVSSAYHKGRLLIQWDPQKWSSNETNVQYSQIVDISDEKDFTIEVGWGSEYGWLECTPPTLINHASSAFLTNNAGSRYNGVLSVSVLNGLTSPSLGSGDSISINVFVSAGDDIEVAVPTNSSINAVSYFPQSGLEFQSGIEEAAVQMDKDDTEQPSIPVQNNVLTTFAESPSCTDHSLDVYHGESITSFRQCLKRYQFVGGLPASSYADEISRQTYLFRHYPPQPNQTTNVSWDDLLGSPTGKNQNKMNLMTYLYPAFAVGRGGTRWRIYRFSPTRVLNSMISMTNYPKTGFAGPSMSTTLNLGSAAEVYQNSHFLSFGGWQGFTATSTENNPVLYAEIPYQTNRRFFHTRDTSRTLREEDKPFALRVAGKSFSSDTQALLCYISASEDFSLHMYVGPPIMYT